MKLPALIALLALFFCAWADAQYDPKPLQDVAIAQGQWRGTLTYDDYSQPGKLVTLPTRLFVALGSPTELVLHFVFEDGPNKTVYSYERMAFDLASSEVIWSSGVTKASESRLKIVSNTIESGVRRLVLEQQSGNGVERYTLELSQKSWILKKEEIEGGGSAKFRNRYELQRVGG